MTEPYGVYREEESESGDLVFKAITKSEPPIELSLTLGDAVHNARTALDHLVWQLVIANGGTPGKDTCWPTTDKPTTAQVRLRGASPRVFDMIMNQIKPFPGGDERFPRLHELDIEDKHHAIVPVGCANTFMNLHVEMKLPGSDRGPIAMPVIGIPPLDRKYPLADGVEVGRVMKAARAESDHFSMKTSFVFDLCFSSDSAPAGEPLVPTIPDLIQGIEGAVGPLIDLLP